jgi:hypothetical protein
VAAVDPEPGEPAELVDAHRIPGPRVEEDDYEKLAEGQLTNIRKLAAAWATAAGVSVLIGLVTGIFVLKGRESIDDLTQPWKVLAPLALGLALLAGVASVLLSARAAYGEPKILRRQDVDAEGGVEVYQGRLARDALRDFQWARRLAVVAVVLMAAGFICTWVSPKSPPAFAKVTFQTGTEATTVCGEVTRSEDSMLILKGVGDPIDLGVVTAIKLVNSCD